MRPYSYRYKITHFPGMRPNLNQILNERAVFKTAKSLTWILLFRIKALNLQ